MMRNRAEVLCACSELTAAIDRYIEKAAGNLAAKLKKLGFLKAKFSVKQLSELEDAIAEALEKESQSIIDGAKKATELKDINVEELISSSSVSDEISEILSDHYNNVLPELTDAYIKQSDKGLSFIATPKRTSDWVNSWSKKVSGFMDDSSVDQISRLLEDHIKSGKGIDDFVRALQESGIRNERYRARTVAVTETLRAHSVAHYDAALQNPCVVDKIWRHSGGRFITPRKNHEAMDGQKVAKDKPFTLICADGAAYSPLYPRDPSLPVGETANCHCTVQDGVDDDILGLPLEERQRLQQEAIDEMDDEWEKEMDEKHRNAKQNN